MWRAISAFVLYVHRANGAVRVRRAGRIVLLAAAGRKMMVLGAEYSWGDYFDDAKGG
jgi:hypothetical protein